MKEEEEEAADLLRLCHTVPLEVVGLGGSSSFGLSLSGTALFLHCEQSWSSLRQEEKATIRRKPTTPALRRGCSATMWME